MIAGYEYRVDGGSWVDIGLPDPLEWTVDGLDPLTTYGFEMRWYDETGDRHELSNEAFATTLGLPAMIQWLRPEAYPALNDGDPITFWQDSSTYNNNATGSAGSAPLYRTNVLNGYPIARFSGAQQLHLLTTPNWSAAEAVIVVKVNHDPSVTAQKSGLWSFNFQNLANHYPYPDSHIYETFATSARKDLGDPAPSLATWRIYNVYSAANDFAAYLDGVQIFHTATNTVAGGRIGARLGVSDAPQLALFYPYLDGDVAEYILWDSKLSGPDRATVLGYLQSKYGL